MHSWSKLGIMSRPLRIELSGGLYHVTSRGDRREAIYRDDQDRADWLVVLEEVCSRFNWRCNVWYEMTNHYHFAVATGFWASSQENVPAHKPATPIS